MLKTAFSEKNRRFVISLVVWMICLIAVPAVAGSYRDSAHGNSGYGVNRTNIDGQFAAFASGNCEHCHDTHASLQGAEPLPADNSAPHALFADSFNTGRTQNFYLETDNFCFYCHSDTSRIQVINQDYSTTFGGGSTGTGPQSIMTTFNQASYHNLYDIWNFLSSDPTYSAWFVKRGNPCSGCHNSHLAKRNWDNGEPGFPLLSAISRPGFSDYLWGESEVMASYFGYEAPYASSGNTREPAGIGDQDGGNTPDYAGFCTSCHNPDMTIWSTTLNRDLKKINWGITGLNHDKHGALTRNGTDIFREPYESAALTKNNFILSCLDCHEAHGSENIMLLRRRVNGENLEGIIVSTDAMSYVCKRCHQDDLAAGAGTGEADRWEYVHHGVTDAPYVQTGCGSCHGPPGTEGIPIPCGNCHGHTMDDSWVTGGNATGRQTF